MAEKIKIGGELDPRTPEKILGDASTIKDRTWETNHGDVVQTPNQKQDEINKYFQDQIDNIVATEQGGIQTDAAPTEGSVKLVQSGGTYTTIQNAATTAKTFLTGETVPAIGIDTNPTNNSTNLVKSGGVKAAIDNVAFSTNEKVNTVGIDDEPTAGSDNLVKSGGVKDYIDSKVSMVIQKDDSNMLKPDDVKSINISSFHGVSAVGDDKCFITVDGTTDGSSRIYTLFDGSKTLFTLRAGITYKYRARLISGTTDKSVTIRIYGNSSYSSVTNPIVDGDVVTLTPESDIVVTNLQLTTTLGYGYHNAKILFYVAEEASYNENYDGCIDLYVYKSRAKDMEDGAITTPKIADEAVSNDKIKNGTIGFDRLGFIESKNLANPNDPGVVNGYLNANGTISTGGGDANYNTTGYIDIEEETDYWLSPTRTRVFFNAAKEVISGSNVVDNTGQVITSPQGAKYLRVCAFANSSTGAWFSLMICQSSEAVEYKPYNLLIPFDKIEKFDATEEDFGLVKKASKIEEGNIDAATSDKVYKETSKLNNHIGYCELIKGGWNTDSEKAVSNKFIIPIEGRAIFTIHTDRPNTDGYTYYYYGQQYNVSSGKTADYSGVASVRVSGNIKPLIGTALEDNDYRIINNPKGLVFSIVEKDGNGNINTALSIADFEGYNVWVEVVGSSTENNYLRNVQLDDVYIRNMGRMSMLLSSCRYNALSDKDLQIAICTDPHRYSTGIEDVIKMASVFKSIDISVCLGDIMGSYYGENNYYDTYNNIVKQADKPLFTVVGNHDVGYFHPVSCGGSHAQIYDSFIKYMVDKGWLSNGEYEVGKPYWYHDIASKKVRLIGLYDYDVPLDYDDTYWEAIAYDSSKPLVALNTSYAVDDIVNCGVYTDNSFKCKQAVTTPASWTDGTNWNKFPSFKLMRGNFMIRQTQAQWLLDTLYSTPANYTVVILKHEALENSTNQQTRKFSRKVEKSWGMYYMATDFLAEAVNAFINKTNFSINVAMSQYAVYLNTEGGGTYAYTVSKDFTTRAANAKFGCYLCGHEHNDYVFKHNTYTQYGLVSICTKPDGGDISKAADSGVASESVNVVSVDKTYNKIRFVKLGANVTNDMELRDVEMIKTDE